MRKQTLKKHTKKNTKKKQKRIRTSGMSMLIKVKKFPIQVDDSIIINVIYNIL